MIRSLKILAIVAAVTMAAPAAMATWYAFGTFEPDYAGDAQAGWMYAEPPANDGSKHVYFNVYPTSTEGQSFTGVNPNVGALETRFDMTGNQYFNALLGVWKDCNGDGYVGLAESAVYEYRVELGQHDSSVCPVDNKNIPGKPYATHNDGTWIFEFLPIANPRDLNNNPVLSTPDKRVYIDHSTMIWGDVGLPGEDLSTTGSGDNCPINPLPRGTLHSTAGILNFVDCNVGFVGLANFPITTIEERTGEDTGLGFETAPWNEEGSPLNQATFGDDSTDESMVTVWDCNNDPVVDEPVGGEDSDTRVTVRGVAPEVKNTGGSVAGTVNETHEGSPSEVILGEGQCNPADDDGNDLYGLFVGVGEGDHDGVEATDKRETGFTFVWSAQSRAGAPSNAALGNQAPQDHGTALLRPFFGSQWGSRSVGVGSTPAIPVRTGITIETEDPGQSKVEPQLGANPTYYTFYAYVGGWSTNGLTLPSNGVTGIYADEWCQGASEGVVLGVNCNADLWNLNEADGSTQNPPSGTAGWAYPGAPYNLRDTDCYDSSVAAATAVVPSTC